MAHDSLGDRMKEQYENRSRFMLPRRSYTLIRCDGKAFHTFTRGCEKPHDYALAAAMNTAARALCEEAQGSCLAYVQSDEISVLLTDFALPTTEAWFDGNLQKIVSVSASVVTSAFALAYGRPGGLFDARVFTIPDPIEVENYFIWRQQDAVRNSIQGLAQSKFSAKEMHGQNTSALQEMLFARYGINWNDTPTDQKRGRCVVDSDLGWKYDFDIPTFTADRDYLRRMIPRAWEVATSLPAIGKSQDVREAIGSATHSSSFSSKAEGQA